jgi:hypothetical protein
MKYSDQIKTSCIQDSIEYTAHDGQICLTNIATPNLFVLCLSRGLAEGQSLTEGLYQFYKLQQEVCTQLRYPPMT